MRPAAAVVCGILCIAAADTTASASDKLTFHADPQRTGWHAAESELTHARVTASDFGLIWESPQFDALGEYPARTYASPLYVDALKISAGAHAGGTFAAIFAATSNGFVYAVNAFDVGSLAAGAILWRATLGEPCKLQPAPLDGVLTGVLSTPVIDRARERLYVTSCVNGKRWQAFALDLASGAILSGWPVTLDEDSLNAPGMNRNAGVGPRAPPKKFDYRVQRGALSLSPDSTMLYVTFGETSTGWLVAVDTLRPRIASAFATIAEPHHSSGGIWGAGGPAVDAAGRIFVVTGTSFSGYVDQPRDWTQSVLQLAYERDAGLTLRGTYTPFNYCETATADIDLGSGGVTLVPDLQGASAKTRTPQLLAVGGKQGNVYLLDRARMPGGLDRRFACSSDSASDRSLLAPHAQPQFGKRGPLNVFGPYSEQDAALDRARARSVPAYFRSREGKNYLFVTGSTKEAEGSAVSVPPSIARLEIVAPPSDNAYLRIDQLERTLLFENPGSPVVTSGGAEQAIVWVLDENASRMASLKGAAAPRPVLYALDAHDLRTLWKSGPGDLRTSGKYNEPVFARGNVFVGTDRIQAFGKGRRALITQERTPPATSVSTTPDIAAPDTLDGKILYQARCAVCHDAAQGRIPPRSLLADRTALYIVGVLTGGSMREQARGLTPDQIRAVARYVGSSDAADR